MKSLNCLSLGCNGIKSISTNEESIKDSNVGSGKKVLPRLSNPLRYKTELCRSFEESGDCRFGQACTFAHGLRELRAVLRHPRYKTDLCRTYHGAGYCQYGARDIWRLGETSTQYKTVIGNPMEVSRSLQIPSIEELIHMP
ncbi:Zinc finger protein 36, C3H1 type-like 1 [Portunus trituberculatus]|uniref:Zinc finger protein 36, C3H1 type-like 1 n=1 Tax=Portunus trituberculatus TaxID=210409 RepID=A0A5B7HQI0_PORTR|nr:Zinc finger protein 36, C3H1 type-like 1 [Portunus trituberculatus]